MKKARTVIAIIAAVILIAAAVAAIILFHEEISDFITDVKDKLNVKKAAIVSKDEFEDYADV